MPNRLPTLGKVKRQRPADCRPSPSVRGYGRNWQKVRESKLSSQPLCEDCLDAGGIVEASEVDHIDADVTNLADSNLRSLCKPCHSRKTVRQDGGLGHAKKID